VEKKGLSLGLGLQLKSTTDRTKSQRAEAACCRERALGIGVFSVPLPAVRKLCQICYVELTNTSNCASNGLMRDLGEQRVSLGSQLNARFRYDGRRIQRYRSLFYATIIQPKNLQVEGLVAIFTPAQRSIWCWMHLLWHSSVGLLVGAF
jgi:hypothetical protein